MHVFMMVLLCMWQLILGGFKTKHSVLHYCVPQIKHYSLVSLYAVSLSEIDRCSVYACCVLVNVYLLHPLNPWMLVFILFTHQYYLSMRAIRVAFRCLYVRVLKCALWCVGSALGNRLGPRLLLPRIKVSAALITSLPASAVFYSVPAAVSAWRNSQKFCHSVKIIWNFVCCIISIINLLWIHDSAANNNKMLLKFSHTASKNYPDPASHLWLLIWLWMFS